MILERRFWIHTVLSAIGLVGLSGTLGLATDYQVPTVIRDATIHLRGGETIENGTILMDKGRIVAVGVDPRVPSHAEVIEANGLHAYPGFVSAHAHLGISDEMRSEEERWLTEDERPDPKQRGIFATRWAHRRGVRPQFRTADHYAPSEDDLKSHRKHGFTSAVVTPRYGVFGGQSCVVNLSDAPRRRVILDDSVGQYASFKAGEPGRYPGTLLGVFALFRQVVSDVDWSIEQRAYWQRHPNSTQRPAVDPALTALEGIVTGDDPVIFEANSAHEIRRALNLATELDLKIAISGAKEAYKVVDRIKAMGVPLIVSLKFSEEPEFGKKGKGRKKPSVVDDAEADAEHSEKSKAEADEKDEDRIYEPLKLRQERRRLWEEQVRNVITLHEAEVKFAFLTHEFDSPGKFFDNLNKVIERGLPAEVALESLTSVPADWLGLSDQIGALSAGQIANVVLRSGPLGDEDGRTRYVFVDGTKFEFDTKKSDKKKKDGKGEDKSRDNNEDEVDEKADASDVDDGPTWVCEIDADRARPMETGGSIVFRHATILTVSGPVFENADLLIRKGKIAGVGPNLVAPKGITEIDATGLYIMPGMVDCHSHLGIDGVNESALAVSAEVRIADTIHPDSVSIFRAAAGGTTTHHAMHGSANPIGGQNVVFKLKYDQPISELIVDDAKPTMKWALGENVKQSNWANARGKRFPNGRMGVEAVIRDALGEAKQYGETWEFYDRRKDRGEDVLKPRRDLRLEALWRVLQGDIWVHTHCYRSDEIIRLMHVAEDFGIRIGVLQHVLEGYRIAPEIARHGASASTFSNFWAYKVEAFEAIPHNAASMTNHGISVSINSDSPNTIRYLNLEAAKAIKWGGLSEREALKLVTLNPATQLGIAHRVGSIELKKDGDLAVFNGHPLNTYSRNVITVIDGEVYFKAADMSPNPSARPIEWNKKSQIAPDGMKSDSYAIIGGTVHTVSDGVIENGTVLVRDGVIDAVGRNLVVPGGAKLIDATGQHVYPGLIDAGGRLGLSEIGSVRATRDDFDIATYGPELRTVNAVHPHSAHIPIARAGGITMQLARPTGGTISGQAGLIRLDGWTADDMVVESEAGLFMTVPSLPAKLSGKEKDKKKRRGAHKKSLRELEAFLTKAKNYARAMKAATENQMMKAPPTDARLAAMRPYLRGEKPVLFNANGYKHILDSIAFAEKHGLKSIIFGGRESWKLADTLSTGNIPVILRSVLSLPSGRFEAYDSVYRCAARLEEAGVLWSPATGSAANVYDLPFNAGMGIAYGVPEERAIRAMTLSAAEILGVGDRFGSIEKGKMADLIIATHPPTQVVSQITAVMIAGKLIDLSNKHSENYERFRNRPRPDLPPSRRLKGPPSFSHRN